MNTFEAYPTGDHRANPVLECHGLRLLLSTLQHLERLELRNLRLQHCEHNFHAHVFVLEQGVGRPRLARVNDVQVQRVDRAVRVAVEEEANVN
eukprot:scaffold47808_cov70-Phaeocystis_antarctica.AAC.9